MNPLKRYCDEEGRGAQARIARRLGFSRSFIADLVAGRRLPNLDLMRRLDAEFDGKIPFEGWKNTHIANNNLGGGGP